MLDTIVLVSLWTNGGTEKSGSSLIPAFFAGECGPEQVYRCHWLVELPHQWCEARLSHVRDEVAEHAALTEQRMGSLRAGV